MDNILVIQSSGRVTRSVTRHLISRFLQKVQSGNVNARAVVRDLTANPPPVVSEGWIAAAYGDPALHGQSQDLRVSEELIAEIEGASRIVIGAPLYNFGVPAQLKAWIDQIIRIDRTFGYDPESTPPYRPLVASKPVLVVTAAGDGSLFPGEALGHLNSLEPLLVNALGFIGLTDIRLIRVGYSEYQDERARLSLAKAEEDIDHEVAMTLALPESSSSGKQPAGC